MTNNITVETKNDNPSPTLQVQTSASLAPPQWTQSDIEVASIPNTYIFHLNTGKIALVQAPVGKFHEAHGILHNWLLEEHPDVTISESYEWRPNNAGYRILTSNQTGELIAFMKLT